MSVKTVKIGIWASLLLIPGIANAQFNTIRKSENKVYETISKQSKGMSASEKQQVTRDTTSKIEVSVVKTESDKTPTKSAQKCGVRKKHLDIRKKKTNLPELTISNLLKEIRYNGIQHEKIVLAQAILETGWFTSNVCRYKNNLFGLTNPRTGEYYEFSHWTESVRAYYTKVQYRYKGGNYLMWLDKIGYAEDPRYVSSLIKILRQYML